MPDHPADVRRGGRAAPIFLIVAIVLAGSVAVAISAPVALSDSRIARCTWKAGGPPSAGDVLDFRNPALGIRQGVIHRNGTVIATITERQARLFADDVIHVRNHHTGMTGPYYEKGCR